MKDFIKKWWYKWRSRNVYPKYRIVFTKGKFYAQINNGGYRENWNYHIAADGKDIWSTITAIASYCTFNTKEEAIDAIKCHIFLKREKDVFNKVEVIDVYISR